MGESYNWKKCLKSFDYSSEGELKTKYGSDCTWNIIINN